MTEIKAVLFDLHGVLVDTTNWHRVALLSALRDFGCKVPIPRSHPVWKIYGGTMKQLAYLDETGWIDNLTPNLLFDIYKKKQEYTKKLIKGQCKPAYNTIALLEYLMTSGYRMAVVTNGSVDNVEAILKAAGISEYFEFVITRETVNGKVKPSPTPYVEAAHRMGLIGGEALAIDDTQRGIMSAIGARCRFWHLYSPEDLTIDNFKRVIDSYEIMI